MNGKDVPEAVLMHWYQCGRKVALATETIAHLYAPHRIAYQCPYASHWHVACAAPSAANNHQTRKSRRQNARRKWDAYAYATWSKTRLLPRGRAHHRSTGAA